MDDGFLPWPTNLKINSFLEIIKNLVENLDFILQDATPYIDKHGNNFYKLNFLDKTVIVDSKGKIERDLYYKQTNSHDYLDFTSHHPSHKEKYSTQSCKKNYCFLHKSRNNRILTGRIKIMVITMRLPTSYY